MLLIAFRKCDINRSGEEHVVQDHRFSQSSVSSLVFPLISTRLTCEIGRRQLHDCHLAKVWKLGCWPWFEHPRVSIQEETQPFFVFGLVLVFCFCFGERRGERNIHFIRSRFIVVEDYSLWKSADLLKMMIRDHRSFLILISSIASGAQS